MTNLQLLEIEALARRLGIEDCGPDAFAGVKGLPEPDDWRGNVPYTLISRWAHLSEEARLCVAMTAQAAVPFSSFTGSDEPLSQAERHALERIP